jgi:hypothetical protein
VLLLLLLLLGLLLLLPLPLLLLRRARTRPSPSPAAPTHQLQGPQRRHERVGVPVAARQQPPVALRAAERVGGGVQVGRAKGGALQQRVERVLQAALQVLPLLRWEAGGRRRR